MKYADTKHLDVFIEGETIDLCTPSCDEYILNQWYRWFNRSDITKYLDQGMYPNTLESQREYCNSMIKDKTRILTLIRPKSQDKVIGVASLSLIDHIHKQCDFAMVIGERTSGKGSLFYGMEAKAMLTQHAFDIVGVERINSSQVESLSVWQKWQILFGYQVEGILRDKFVKGSDKYDVYISACLKKDYIRILDKRDGRLWPGKNSLLDMIRKVPSYTLIDTLSDWLPKEQEEYWNKIFDI